MSEKKRGRQRDNQLDLCADGFPEIRTRMSTVNRRDMMLTFDFLRLDTPEGQREFAYIFNNGNLRMSVLTELGRYIRRYGMSSNDVAEFARIICKEKVKAKKVKEMLESYRHLNSSYKMRSYHAIQLAWTICQGKLKLKQVEKMLRTYGMRPRIYEIKYIKENYPEKFQEIIKGRKTIPQVKQEIENETEYRETDWVEHTYFIRRKNFKDFMASCEKLLRLIWTATANKADNIGLSVDFPEKGELDKLIREGKVRLESKNPEVFKLNEKD